MKLNSIKKFIVLVSLLMILSLALLNINSILGFVGGIVPNTLTFLGTLNKPKGKILVSYYSLDWMPDGKRIAYIKAIEHVKYIYGWYIELNLVRRDTKYIEYQICILDLDTNKEKVIRTIKVYPKSDHFGYHFWYEWNDNKYEGIKEVTSLDVNPVDGQILITTLGSEQYLKFINPYSGPIFILNGYGGNFTKIINDGLKAIWPYDGKKIVYGVDEVEIETRGEGKDRVSDEIHHCSLWIKDLVKNENRKVLDGRSDVLLSPDAKKIFYYRDDKLSDKYPSRVIDVAHIIDLDTLEETEMLYARDIVWSPDNKKIAYNLIFPVEEKDRRYKYSVGIGELKNNKFIENFVIDDASSPVWNLDGTVVLYYSHADDSKYLFDILKQKKVKVNIDGDAIKWISPTKILCANNTKGFLMIDLKDMKILYQNDIFSDNLNKYVVPYSIISLSPDHKKMLGAKNGLFVMDLDNCNYRIFAKDYEREFK